MRDIAVTLIVVVGLFYTLKRPWLGVLLVSWIGYMNPHRLTWGFAYNMPFAAMAAGATLIALLTTRERQWPPAAPAVWIWGAFIILVTISTLAALFPDFALKEYTRFIKIQIGILFTLMLIRNETQVRWLVAVIAYSIGFYGIKGGIFTIATAGNFRVWGPEGSFIAGNNEIALALLMVLPLMYYLYLSVSHRWLKRGILVGMLLCLASVIGSQSRGAFVGLIATLTFLWWQSPRKLPLALAGLVLIAISLPMLPEHWVARMQTIETYEQDASAMGRINAWTTGSRVAKDYVFGGGFGVYWSDEIFARYAPQPDNRNDAHSIYFEVLGEQGFPGLVVWLLLWLTVWQSLGRTIRIGKRCRKAESLALLARMIKVSLVAYATGGAFLGLAYWDLPYHFFALAVLIERIVVKYQEENQREERQPGAPDMKPHLHDLQSRRQGHGAPSHEQKASVRQYK